MKTNPANKVVRGEVNLSPEPKGHAHRCLNCDAIIAEGQFDGCELDADHDWALCPACVARGVDV